MKDMIDAFAEALIRADIAREERARVREGLARTARMIESARRSKGGVVESLGEPHWNGMTNDGPRFDWLFDGVSVFYYLDRPERLRVIVTGPFGSVCDSRDPWVGPLAYRPSPLPRDR